MKEIVEKLYHSMLTAKFTHLINPTKTYAIHYALDTYQDDIQDELDSLVETTLNDWEDKNIVVTDIKNLSAEDTLKYFMTLYEEIEVLRADYPSYVQSTLDNIQSINKQLQYRLINTIS